MTEHPWTFEEKREAAMRAPLGPGLLRRDTEVIERPGWYQLVTPSAHKTTLNEVTWSELAPTDAEDAIDDVIRRCHSVGRPVKWCVGPWTKPADFGERLARRGFGSWEVRGMGRETTPLPPSRRKTVNVQVVTVDEATAPAHVATSMYGWDIPADQELHERAVLIDSLRAMPRLAYFFAALAGTTGACVGTASVLLRSLSGRTFGYLSAAQVLPSARGLGAYQALTDARLAFLRTLGIGYAVTQARETTSAPILERLGFETLFHSKCYRLDSP